MLPFTRACCRENNSKDALLKLKRDLKIGVFLNTPSRISYTVFKISPESSELHQSITPHGRLFPSVICLLYYTFIFLSFLYDYNVLILEGMKNLGQHWELKAGLTNILNLVYLFSKQK